MVTTPRRYWWDMTRPEMEALDTDRVIAVLPVGAVESHGPHLPVGVDAMLNEAMLKRVWELVPADLPVTALPGLHVGMSEEHVDYPGTIMLEAETLINVWTESAASVARAGVRKLVLLNSHGGQAGVADIVIRRLRIKYDMMVFILHWFRFPPPAGLFGEDERLHGIHGGEVETSLMLHVRPDLVDMSKAADFVPLGARMAAEYEHIRPTGSAVSFGWKTQDLNLAGAAGNAANADAERGRLTFEAAARQTADVLQEIDRLPLSTLQERSGR
jgi:creatinine amidohydrolase